MRERVQRRRGLGLVVLATISLAGGCAPGREIHAVRLSGGHMPTELVQGWLEHCSDPVFRLSRVGSITFSIDGFERLAKGECDLACVDRPISPRELEAFAEVPIGRRVGFYGFALYVNPSNPVDSLFAKHLKMILRGEIKDWSEIGGEAGPIRLIGPQRATRGGRLLLGQAGIFFDKEPWEAIDSDAGIVDAVAADPQALGFAAVGYVGPARYLGLRLERAGEAVLPSLEAIEKDRYPLAKVIYVYHRADADAGPREAVRYLFSPRGQVALENAGIAPIPFERSAVEAR
ncbi:MAG: substrate-binding domain-containing protein [Phycisphaerales bacterium]|nr:substrate-binding domain-containing protein [Phycisphaerales bacterium]